MEDSQGVDRCLAVGVTGGYDLPSCLVGEGARQLAITGVVQQER